MLDIKLKNNPKMVWLAVFLVLCFCSAGMILFYPSIWSSAQKSGQQNNDKIENNLDDFNSFAEGNYVLYNQISKETSQADVLEEDTYDDFRLLERYTDYSITDEEENILLKSSESAAENLKNDQSSLYEMKVEFVFDS